jgi:hypothetical protein
MKEVNVYCHTCNIKLRCEFKSKIEHDFLSEHFHHKTTLYFDEYAEKYGDYLGLPK